MGKSSERWKSVADYEGLYEVSDLGNVRSLKRATTSGKVLKLYVNRANGYVYACLSKDNKKRQCRVHKLVMKAFAPKDGDLQINHIDGNKQNNALTNLEWCTQSENMKHAYAMKLEKPPTKRVIDLTTGSVYESLNDAAVAVGGKKSSAISRVCSGTRSQYRNHVFAYYSDYISNTVPTFRGRFRKKSTTSLWVK